LEDLIEQTLENIDLSLVKRRELDKSVVSMLFKKLVILQTVCDKAERVDKHSKQELLKTTRSLLHQYFFLRDKLEDGLEDVTCPNRIDW